MACAVSALIGLGVAAAGAAVFGVPVLGTGRSHRLVRAEAVLAGGGSRSALRGRSLLSMRLCCFGRADGFSLDRDRFRHRLRQYGLGCAFRRRCRESLGNGNVHELRLDRVFARSRGRGMGCLTAGEQDQGGQQGRDQMLTHGFYLLQVQGLGMGGGW